MPAKRPEHAEFSWPGAATSSKKENSLSLIDNHRGRKTQWNHRYSGSKDQPLLRLSHEFRGQPLSQSSNSSSCSNRISSATRSSKDLGDNKPVRNTAFVVA